MNTASNPAFEATLAARRSTIQLESRNQRLAQLVRLIDELSSEMGSSDFRETMRAKGYDIDACTATLQARGVNINN